jgi:hypothetical protein
LLCISTLFSLCIKTFFFLYSEKFFKRRREKLIHFLRFKKIFLKNSHENKKSVFLLLKHSNKKISKKKMSVRRPAWSFFVPTTAASKIRKVSVAAPLLLFVASADAILCKQENFRANLADEDIATTDRINRRSYVALPNGEMALVHPQINTDFSISGILRQFVETLNPMP